jgi:uncharacterized protein YjbI with pentapeptide repeats
MGPRIKSASVWVKNFDGERLAEVNQNSLVGAKLSGTFLPDANLEGVDLSRATLDDSYISRASFRGANLRGSILSIARIISSDFSGAT